MAQKRSKTREKQRRQQTRRTQRPVDVFMINPEGWNSLRALVDAPATGLPLPVEACIQLYSARHDPHYDDQTVILIVLALTFYQDVPEAAALLAVDDRVGCTCHRCTSRQEG